MQENYFLFEDKIQEIKSKFSTQNGWLKIYETASKGTDDSSGLYCCLVAKDQLETYRKDYSWPFLKGSEGKPSVYGNNSYKTYDEEGLEPFLFYKSFNLPEGTINYIDIAEEFVLYFRLYEKGTDKQNRTFFYVNDYGELDEVIIIEPKLIRVKIKYLKEYITIRNMNFIVCFDFMRLVDNVPTEWNISHKDELMKETDFIYNHLIRSVIGKTQSWIMGKVFIKPNEIKKTHFDFDDNQNEEFIVGHDEEGELVYEDCGNSEGNHFRVTYFKREVLDKYYNDPTQYNVDGFHVSSNYFTLKIDNNAKDYVPVFLNNLRQLPPKEQLHWKQYNIPPKEDMNISRTYYTTMIEGRWAQDHEAADLHFKSKYKEFNKKWEKKFGWQLYKPFSQNDEHLFTSLHRVTSNNVKAFCEQTLTIVKLTIDRLNEKEIVKGLNIEPSVKGISKFEKFLESNDMKIPDLFEFLRNLQSLRSGLIAHSFSEKNKDCKKAMEYFGIDEGKYIEAAEQIFIKSISTFYTLEEYFVLDEIDEDLNEY